MAMKTNMKVLIVDDNAIMRNFIRDLISELTVNIWQAVDGLEAVAWARDHKPDLILMDIRMPGFDGIEAARRILKENPGSKVVIVTECDSRELRLDARESGCLAYVLKDDLEVLPEIVTGLLHLN